MKTIIISLLLYFTVNAQTVRYVDVDATGSNNGSSWANAWESFESINWGTVTNGDIIYVSDGVYDTDRIWGSNEVFTTQVNVRPSTEVGHTGQVIITSYDATGTREVFNFKNVSNVKLTGFTFIENRSEPTTNEMVLIQHGSYLSLDSCHVIGKGIGNLVHMSDNAHQSRITNCILENLYNEDVYNDQDIINIDGNDGGHHILNNLLIMRNEKGAENNRTGGHRDGIQMSNYGSEANLEDVIANNIILDQYPHESGQTGLIYAYQGNDEGNRRLLIYNNVLVTRATGNMNIITCGGDTAIQNLDMSLRVLNNTIIGKGSYIAASPPYGPEFTTSIVAWKMDTLIIKNNLIINDTSVTPYFLNFDTYYWENQWLPDSIEIDYNIYSRRGGSTASFSYLGFANSWATFLSDGYEANGDTVNWNSVSFSNKYDSLATGYYTTTGRDAGEDLSAEFPFLAYDILGNPRSGTWDIGALESLDLNAVLLTHSSGSRLYDYETYMGVDSGDITTVPLEMVDYNNANLLSTVSMERRWYPVPDGTDWVNWYRDFRGELSGNNVYEKLDTFNVIIFKGGIQTCNMTGYGSATDTLSENLATTIDDKTTIMYKYIWRELVDSMAAHPEAFWVIMTGSASGDENNTPTGAQLAHEFATWAKDTLAMGLDAYGDFPANIYVFDYFHYLADAEHYLKDEYESGYSEGQDDHPNATACNDIAPIFVQEVFDAAALYEGYTPSSAIVDSLPDAFTFMDITNATRSTPYTSNGVTLAGFDSAYAYASGNVYTVNAGSDLTGYTRVFPDDVLRLKLTSSPSYSTATNRTLTVGSRSDTYTVTTEAPPTPPSGNGGWVRGSDGRGIFGSNGRRIIGR